MAPSGPSPLSSSTISNLTGRYDYEDAACQNIDPLDEASGEKSYLPIKLHCASPPPVSDLRDYFPHPKNKFQLDGFKLLSSLVYLKLNLLGIPGNYPITSLINNDDWISQRAALVLEKGARLSVEVRFEDNQLSHNSENPFVNITGLKVGVYANPFLQGEHLYTPELLTTPPDENGCSTIRLNSRFIDNEFSPCDELGLNQKNLTPKLFIENILEKFSSKDSNDTPFSWTKLIKGLNKVESFLNLFRYGEILTSRIDLKELELLYGIHFGESSFDLKLISHPHGKIGLEIPNFSLSSEAKAHLKNRPRQSTVHAPGAVHPSDPTGLQISYDFNTHKIDIQADFEFDRGDLLKEHIGKIPFLKRITALDLEKLLPQKGRVKLNTQLALTDEGVKLVSGSTHLKIENKGPALTKKDTSAILSKLVLTDGEFDADTFHLMADFKFPPLSPYKDGSLEVSIPLETSGEYYLFESLPQDLTAKVLFPKKNGNSIDGKMSYAHRESEGEETSQIKDSTEVTVRLDEVVPKLKKRIPLIQTGNYSFTHTPISENSTVHLMEFSAGRVYLMEEGLPISLSLDLLAPRFICKIEESKSADSSKTYTIPDCALTANPNDQNTHGHGVIKNELNVRVIKRRNSPDPKIMLGPDGLINIEGLKVLLQAHGLKIPGLEDLHFNDFPSLNFRKVGGFDVDLIAGIHLLLPKGLNISGDLNGEGEIFVKGFREDGDIKLRGPDGELVLFSEDGSKHKPLYFFKNTNFKIVNPRSISSIGISASRIILKTQFDPFPLGFIGLFQFTSPPQAQAIEWQSNRLPFTSTELIRTF